MSHTLSFTHTHTYTHNHTHAHSLTGTYTKSSVVRRAIIDFTLATESTPSQHRVEQTRRQLALGAAQRAEQVARDVDVRAVVARF